MTGVPRLLIVEDDDRIRLSLRMALEDEGYTVKDVPTAEEGLADHASSPADLVLVDLMLPGMDGYDCIRALRKLGDVPIVVVSARDDTHDVVAALEAGADDYVVKPVAVKELTARLRALRRRARGTGTDGPKALRFGEIELRPEAGEVQLGDDPVHLTRTEFRLLCELADQAGRVLSRQQLLDRVWGYEVFGDDRLVDVHVGRLRRKIERDPANPKHLLTVRGLGYKLQA
jgi:two-component system, OmpR family, response regulator RegX3